MQSNLQITFKLSENPSLAAGDLANFQWLEEITGFRYLGSANIPLTGSATHYIMPSAFVHNPQLLIIRFDKDVTVQFYGYVYGNGQTSGPVPIQIMDERYGYVLITAPQQTQQVIVTTTETTEALFACFGDPES